MTAADSALAGPPGQALAAAYEETYAAILAILGALRDRQLSTIIPACPAWTVRELVAHMTGVAADAVAARFAAVNPHGTWAERQPIIDAFTAGHIKSRRAMAVDELVAEWAGHVHPLTKMLRGEQPFPAGSMPGIDWVVVSDIGAHAHDLRGALNTPGERGSAAPRPPALCHRVEPANPRGRPVAPASVQLRGLRRLLAVGGRRRQRG